MTATATAPRLEALSPSALAPHPNNPRRAVTVSAGDPLVASIKAQGVLEPLIAAPASDTMKVPGKASYFVLAGHRRLAAAKLAKVKTVPVIIRDDLTDLVAQVETMLVENIHREDLSPVEEGDAYQLLLDLDGLTQATLAEQVGQPRNRVRDRLKIAAAPDVVRDRLHARQITIENALALVKLEAAPDLLQAALDAVGTPNEAWYIESGVRRVKEREEARKVLAACERDPGLTRLDQQAGWDSQINGGLLHQPHGYRYDGDDPAADHAPGGSCPNRAYNVYVDKVDGEEIPSSVRFACTDPVAHRVELDGDDGPTATVGDRAGVDDQGHGVGSASQPELTEEEKEQRVAARVRHEQLLDAQTVRLRHVRSCMVNPPKGAAQTLMLALSRDPESLYIDDSDETYCGAAVAPLQAYWREQRREGALLLDIDDTQDGQGTPDEQAERLAAGWASFKALPLEGQVIYQWWLSSLASEVEDTMTNRHGRRLTADEARYVAALTDVLGYQWSTIEQDLLGITENGRVVDLGDQDDTDA